MVDHNYAVEVKRRNEMATPTAGDMWQTGIETGEEAVAIVINDLGSMRLDGQLLARVVGSPLEQLLFAGLALAYPEPVTADRLLELLWAGQRPEPRRLWTHVYRLKRALSMVGDGEVTVSRQGDGYALTGSLVRDSDRFDELVGQAEADVEAHRPGDAMELLQEALGLWRGRPLGDMDLEPFAPGLAARLEERHGRALVLAMRVRLDETDAGTLIGELEQLAASRPFDEEVTELLVVALHRVGRRVEALRRIRAFRQDVAEEVGVGVSPRLTDLENQLLGDEPAVRLSDGPGHRGPPDEGPAIGTAGVLGLPSPSAPMGAARTNVPTFEPLIGRDGEVGHLLELVRSHRLVTITGPGGVGKSRLAVRVASELVGETSDGCWLVDLAPVDDPSRLVNAVAAVLPLAAMPFSATDLVDQIGTRQMLVVLDNCEHLIDGVATLVAELLARSPGVRLLCTSREPLAIDREHARPLPSLAPEAAIALFNERARAVQPDLDDDPVAVAVIVERLDSLPLAIELAAGRVSMFSPAEIAAQLDDRFHLLSMGGRAVHPRHRALRAVVDWSHDLLGPGERKLFRRLGIFPSSFSRDAAAQIACLDEADASTMVDDLHRLVRRSMVVADIGPTATRYRLLETLRYYALDRLGEACETDALARRHAHWYADLTAAFEAIASPEETLWLARGLAELDNYRSAIGFALSHGDTDLAVRLVGGLWRLDDLWNADLLDWARQTVTLPGADAHPDVGYVHLIIASLAFVTGDRDASEWASEQALHRPLTEDAWLRAWSVKWRMLLFRGRLDECRAIVPSAHQRLTSPANRTELEARLFGLQAFTGPSEIDRSPDELIAGADATGIPALRAFARTMVALGWVAQGRLSDAGQLLERALEIAQPGLNRRVVNIAGEVQALAAGAEHHDRSADDFTARVARVLDIIRDYPLALGFSLVGLVRAADQEGRHHVAAMLAGYISSHLDELALMATSAEVMAGRPLDRYATPVTRPRYDRGRAMSSTDLLAELQRLAN